ncbi:MAG: biliverdin-producing heme oxygenase [Alphaproteobacteria bacterium]
MREELKRRTAAAHSQVDALYGRLDIAAEPGLTHFLAAHLLALSSIAKARPAPPAGMPSIGMARLRGLLAADLASLDRAVDVDRAPAMATPRDPIGVAYVVGGSRLGTAVLRTHWRRGDAPRVRTAGRYLADQEGLRDWRRLVSYLDSLTATPKRADEIVAGALSVFACFEAAFRIAPDALLNTRVEDAAAI